MTLSEYRALNGLTLEQFAARVHKSKGHIHAVEKENYATAKLALAIEKATDGEVSAAFLNPTIAEVRKAAA